MALVAMALVLGACQSDEVAQAPETEDLYEDRFQISTLSGLLQTSPDEFGVVTKRPLEMPRSFAALPVPEPGRISSRDPDPQADARAALSFAPAPIVPATSAPSASEAAILASAGQVDPSIRATLAAEQGAYEATQDRYLLDRIFPRLREARGDLYPDAIDAEQERVRLVEAGITPQRTGAITSVPTPATVPSAPPVPVTGIPAVAPVAPAPAVTVTVPAAGAGAAPLIYLPQ